MSISPGVRGPASAHGFVERRAQARTSVMDRRLVTVNLDDRDAGLMVDISEDGMAVQALARIRQGATTSLHFELPDTPARVEAIGTVTWVDSTSGRAGIRFTSISEDARASVRQWVSQQHQPTTTNSSTRLAVPAVLGPDSKVAEIASLQRQIANQGLDCDAALALIADRMRSLTRASGSAVLLGDSKVMICRASSGSAPPVGADLLPQSGLSGECVRTGVTVRCEDTELDPRVDRQACRQIGLRSVVIVPLFARGSISGLVEIFYASPRAFDGRDVLTLRRMADLISATLARPTARPVSPAVSNQIPAVARVAPAPALRRSATPVAGPARERNPEPEIAEPVQNTPASPSKAGVVICDVCGHANAASNTDCEKCDVPLPGRLAGVPAGEASPFLDVPQPRIGYDLLAEYMNEEAGRDRITVRLAPNARLIAVAAMVLLLVGFLAWKQRHRRPPEPISDFSNSLPASTMPAAAAIPASARVAITEPSPESAIAKPSPVLPARSNVRNSAQGNRASVPPGQPRHDLEQVAMEAPPAVMLPASSRAGASVLSIPAEAPKLSGTGAPSSTIVPARLLHKVEPAYPQIAVYNRLQGSVVLKATILSSGRLGNIQVEGGNELLVPAALKAVQQWRYQPQERDGKFTESDTRITINFSLGNSTD